MGLEGAAASLFTDLTALSLMWGRKPNAADGLSVQWLQGIPPLQLACVGPLLPPRTWPSRARLEHSPAPREPEPSLGLQRPAAGGSPSGNPALKAPAVFRGVAGALRTRWQPHSIATHRLTATRPNSLTCRYELGHLTRCISELVKKHGSSNTSG